MSRGEGARNRGSESAEADSDDDCAHRVRYALRADARLEGLIASWPTLPEAVRAGILAMVEAAGGGSDKGGD